jgi:hypothetical protein
MFGQRVRKERGELPAGRSVGEFKPARLFSILPRSGATRDVRSFKKSNVLIGIRAVVDSEREVASPRRFR